MGPQVNTDNVTATTATEAGLTAAFEAFNAHSLELNAAYDRLQSQVATLATALRRARHVRNREAAARERLAERMAQILEALPALVLIVDANGHITDANAKASEAFSAPLIGDAWSEVANAALGCAQPAAGEYALGEHWYTLTESPLDAHARLVVFIDVTAARANREGTERQQRLAMLGEMAARLAHQIRTPLSTAMLWASRAGDDAARSRIVARLNDIESMVDDMLRFANGTPADERVMDITALVEEVVDDARGLAPAHVKLRVNAPDPGPRVCGNVRALGGAIANLVVNAVQHSPEDGTVTIAVDGDGDTVYIAVRDEGSGIRAGLTDQIFEPFFTTRPAGTGLGLAVVRSVAQAHGGDITVESSPSGSCFSLHLPVARTDFPPVGGTSQFSAISAHVPPATFSKQAVGHV